MNFLIAPNSFKECGDSVRIASLFVKNLEQKTKCNLIPFPISDGGDGFLSVCEEVFNLKKLKYKVKKPYNNQSLTCEVGYDSIKKNIYIESASVLGMKVIPKNQRKLGKINSKGLGELLKKIAVDVSKKKLSVERAFIGIGGTGTNDFALGTASIFGTKLFVGNKLINIEPAKFSKVTKIESAKIELPFKIISVIDVKNKLLGKNGAVYTFAKQKGAKQNQLPNLEKGFSNIIDLLKSEGLGKNKNLLSGAGGGLAAGLKILFDSEVISSRDFIMNYLGLKNIKRKIDFVITGEGAFDHQSLMEKGAGIIIEHFQNSAKNIFLCCGKIDSKILKKLPSNVFPIEFLQYFKNERDSIKNYQKAIKLASNEVAVYVK